ncbi:membrane-associating domain-containing protein [Rutstroemia sp. NJR-2017a WRK4]|nr:membrane-associating domain-containing protein [Rutstroemia sp. NJR-2017a BBW]PQE32635.1 membrane-associating domain-containing protein [Rutstroemia sp. NJR-2017a WRK4]
MLFGMFFAFWRFMEIITLIPTLGMLAYFVHIYDSHNALTPDYILVLFIVSVLAAAWAIATLFTYHRARSNALFVSFIDLCFVGALIAGVYELRFISNSNCSAVTTGASYYINFGALGNANVNGVSVKVDKTCAMLKACFAFGIMNIIFFAITSLLACLVGRGHERGGRRNEKVVVRETHVSRHGHRRSGSHRSHRSSRRAYV